MYKIPRLSLRPCVAEDQAFLLRLYASSHAGAVPASAEAPEAMYAVLALQFSQQQADYQRHFPGAERLLIELDGFAAGRLYLHEQATHIQLIDLALMPQWRGRGIGCLVLSALRARAECCGKSVALSVTQSHPVAAWTLRGTRSSPDTTASRGDHPGRQSRATATSKGLGS